MFKIGQKQSINSILQRGGNKHVFYKSPRMSLATASQSRTRAEPGPHRCFAKRRKRASAKGRFLRCLRGRSHTGSSRLLEFHHHKACGFVCGCFFLSILVMAFLGTCFRFQYNWPTSAVYKMWTRLNDSACLDLLTTPRVCCTRVLGFREQRWGRRACLGAGGESCVEFRLLCFACCCRQHHGWKQWSCACMSCSLSCIVAPCLLLDERMSLEWTCAA